tara:strand:+ start:3732 stop:3977 length:246 start_codon:yes stop_codon:yes gene_type:complete
MSLSVNLDSTKTITTVAAVTETISDFQIQRIVDFPAMKVIKVKLSCCEDLMTLSDLSNDNYGNDWTYTQVSNASKNLVASM